ncbi:MAG: extracellular solute-binding protein [Candidatus Omnitrophota bacterium]
MKKPFALLFLGCLIINVFGCAKQEKTAAAPAAKPQIVVWHWMTDREDAFLELARRYEKITGVKVKLELYAPSESYSTKVKAAAQTNTLPDVYSVLGESRDFASFIKAGLIENLTRYMDENNNAWRGKLFAKALAMSEMVEGNEFQVQPGTYGVPIDCTNIQFLYNKDLFKQAGLDPENPPKTWPEFIEAGKKLKAAGIAGVVSGWGETWMINSLADDFAWNIMGREKIIKTIKGEVKYTDPDWVKVFTLFKEMRDAEMLAPGIVTMVNKIAEQNFANQRAAIAFNGSWCVNVYYHMNPDLNYAAMLPPMISENYPCVIWGGAGSSFMVNARSSRKQQAIAFLKWLTDKEQQAYLAKETRNLPANKDSLGSIPPILAQFADDMDNIIHPRFLPVSERPLVTEAIAKGIQSIIIKEKTPKEVAEDVQRSKNEEIASVHNLNG